MSKKSKFLVLAVLAGAGAAVSKALKGSGSQATTPPAPAPTPAPPAAPPVAPAAVTEPDPIEVLETEAPAQTAAEPETEPVADAAPEAPADSLTSFFDEVLTENDAKKSPKA